MKFRIKRIKRLNCPTFINPLRRNAKFFDEETLALLVFFLSDMTAEDVFHKRYATNAKDGDDFKCIATKMA
jgi:hypothetical protein